MMRFHTLVLLSITALSAATGPAYGQQPPDVVQSDGGFNTAMGTGAMAQAGGLVFNNTAVGYNALNAGPGGGMCCGGNTAVGANALQADTSGAANTGIGLGVLYSNVTGSANAAIGNEALAFSASGSYNTASGNWAMRNNVSGSNNTVAGFAALSNNGTGSYNTGSGVNALLSNSSGNYNVAAGANALYSNATGNDNTAIGPSAMYGNVTGRNNTALGSNALGTNQGGSNNIAVGVNAGDAVRGGNNNIEIGNVGTANDAGTTRIGTSSQQGSAYIAGIVNSHVAGSAVYITASGQLGVLASSERYKTDVASMGSTSEKVRELRPVTFHLKTDPKGGRQYGLIAEEVAKVYPELVIRGEKGQIEGVRYEELTPMLLNEIQRQQAQLHDMQQQLAELQQFRRSVQGRAASQ